MSEDTLKFPHKNSLQFRKAMRTIEDEPGWQQSGGAFTNFFSPTGDILDVYETGKWAEDRWIVDGLVRSGSNCLIVGDSNVGKTYICLELAVAMVSGTRFVDHFECDRGPVIYFGGEGDKDLLIRRINNLVLGRGMDPKEFMRKYRKMLTLSLPEDFSPRYPMPLANKDFQDHTLNLIRGYPRNLRPRAFFWDPLTALVPDVDHDPSAIQGIVNFLKILNKECDATSFILHHPKKIQPNSPVDRRNLIRGESSWVNFADDVIYLDGDPEDMGLIHFWGNKARDAAAPGDTESMFAVRREFADADDYDCGFDNASQGSNKRVRFTYVAKKRKAAKKEDKKTKRNIDDNVVELAPRISPLDQMKRRIIELLSMAKKPLSPTDMKNSLGTVEESVYYQALGQLTEESRVDSLHNDRGPLYSLGAVG